MLGEIVSEDIGNYKAKQPFKKLYYFLFETSKYLVIYL